MPRTRRTTDDIAATARRRTRMVVAAAALALLGLVAAATGLAVALGQRGAPAPGPPGVATTADAPPPTATVVPAPSGLDSSAPPDDLSWVRVAGATVPVSATAGPREDTGGRARGFAHTPMGAVLAAVHISVRLCPQAGPVVFEPTLAEQVVGADVDALAKQLDEDYQAARAQLDLPYDAAAGRLYSRTIGYQVELQGPDIATVNLLIEGPGTSGGSVLVALAIRMRWIREDWALVAPAGGDWNNASTLVTDRTGYTRFQGER